MMKKAFTLIEVNLAMLIMAGGILTIVGLYSFGFRENSQSIEDVAGAAMADAVMSPLIMALSATNVTWSAFNSLETYPAAGWKAYLNTGDYTPVDNPEATAKTAFSDAIGRLSVGADYTTAFPQSAIPSGYKYGLVVNHKKDSGVVSIAFRATKKAKMLLSQPLYYTEVRFQGVQTK